MHRRSGRKAKSYLLVQTARGSLPFPGTGQESQWRSSWWDFCNSVWTMIMVAIRCRKIIPSKHNKTRKAEFEFRKSLGKRSSHALARSDSDLAGVYHDPRVGVVHLDHVQENHSFLLFRIYIFLRFLFLSKQVPNQLVLMTITSSIWVPAFKYIYLHETSYWCIYIPNCA